MGALFSVIAFLGCFAAFRFASVSSKDTTLVRFPEKPAILRVKRAKDSNELEDISLENLVETRCKSLFTQFKPTWWLFNGHLQTIYTTLGDFSRIDRVLYNRQYLRLLDGGTLGLDFTPINHSEMRCDTPIIVVQHGLTGGSYEAYVRAVLGPACKPIQEGGLGYRAVVVNFRGCAGVPVTSPQLYSAGCLDDLRQALMYISYRYPDAPLLGLGFSLGANVITRYLAEEGTQSRLLTGCALACPWDLEANNIGLCSSFLGRNVYAKALGRNLLKIFKRHVKSLQVDPEHRAAKAVPYTLALKNPRLDEFDTAFTRLAGGPSPSFPFKSVNHYYRWASSHYLLKDVKVPFLAINAADDPVIKYVPKDGEGNGLVMLALTPSGGHLGWFESRFGRWTTQPLLEWFRVMGEELVHESVASQALQLYVNEDGYVKQEGRPLLGCKAVEGGGVIDGNGGENGMIQGL